MSLERQKLDTAIEREMYKFITMIKEYSFDQVMIWATRKNIDMDRGLLIKILETYKTAIEDGFMTKVDTFSKGIEKALNEYTESVNPTLPTSKSK